MSVFVINETNDVILYTIKLLHEYNDNLLSFIEELSNDEIEQYKKNSNQIIFLLDVLTGKRPPPPPANLVDENLHLLADISETIKIPFLEDNLDLLAHMATEQRTLFDHENLELLANLTVRLPRRRVSKAKSIENIYRVKELRQEGFTKKEIADILHISISTVNKILK